jgi:hypothetical protein
VCSLREQSLKRALQVNGSVVQISAVGPSRRVEVRRNRQHSAGPQSLTPVAGVFGKAGHLRRAYRCRSVMAWITRHQLGQVRGDSALCGEGGPALRSPGWQLPAAASPESEACGQNYRLHNKALHLTKGAWSGPSISSEGRSLRAPFAGERRCSTDEEPS